MFLAKRAVRVCHLRGNRLLFGYALTVFCRADSARPLIGCLDMNIMCWRQCSDQSEARIPVTARYRILTDVGPGGKTWLLSLTTFYNDEAHTALNIFRFAVFLVYIFWRNEFPMLNRKRESLNWICKDKTLVGVKFLLPYKIRKLSRHLNKSKEYLKFNMHQYFTLVFSLTGNLTFFPHYDLSELIKC